jgi:hypothetical protein
LRPTVERVAVVGLPPARLLVLLLRVHVVVSFHGQVAGGGIDCRRCRLAPSP